MDADRHKQDFDDLYSGLCRAGKFSIDFPLEQIERFHWNRGRWADAYYSYFYRRFSSHILSRLELSDGQKILVLGCGFGFDEKNIKSLFGESDLWSIDISEEMLGRAILGQSPSHFSLSLGERLPFPDSCFDRVLSREVIEHVMDPGMVLGEISRVLKPGGIAVVTTENDESFSPSNYYDSRMRPRIAGYFGQRMPGQGFKDMAPALDEMKKRIHGSGLVLEDLVYDGVLYKFLPELGPIIRNKMPKVAQLFSSLENNPRTAFAFCDQVKYILRKGPGDIPGECVPQDVFYACVHCKGRLFVSGAAYSCPGCGRIYLMKNGVPDFIPKTGGGRSAGGASAEDIPDKAEGPENNLFGVLARSAFKVADLLLRSLYSGMYLLSAFLCTFFVQSNNEPLSRVIGDKDPFQKYLKV